MDKRDLAEEERGMQGSQNGIVNIQMLTKTVSCAFSMSTRHDIILALMHGQQALMKRLAGLIKNA